MHHLSVNCSFIIIMIITTFIIIHAPCTQILNSNKVSWKSMVQMRLALPSSNNIVHHTKGSHNGASKQSTFINSSLKVVCYVNLHNRAHMFHISLSIFIFHIFFYFLLHNSDSFCYCCWWYISLLCVYAHTNKSFVWMVEKIPGNEQCCKKNFSFRLQGVDTLGSKFCKNVEKHSKVL